MSKAALSCLVHACAASCTHDFPRACAGSRRGSNRDDSLQAPVRPRRGLRTRRRKRRIRIRRAERRARGRPRVLSSTVLPAPNPGTDRNAAVSSAVMTRAPRPPYSRSNGSAAVSSCSAMCNTCAHDRFCEASRRCSSAVPHACHTGGGRGAPPSRPPRARQARRPYLPNHTYLPHHPVC